MYGAPQGRKAAISDVRSQKLENIQALRGLAALGVFLAHVREAEGDYAGADALLPEAVLMGVSGVDLFFVISGYVMVHVAAAIHAGGRAAARFFYNRAARIYPLYWLASLALLVLYIGKAELFGEATPIPNFFASFLLVPDADYPILPVGWTLVHEMYFYLVFAAALFLAPGRRPLFLLGWGAAVVAGAVLGLGTAGAWGAVWFSPLTYEFLAGAGLALLMRRGVAAAAFPALGAGLVALLAVSGLRVDLYPDVFTDHAARALLYGPIYALIVYGAVAVETRRGAIAPRWLRRTGDASYALYLVHVPVVLVVGRLVAAVPAGGQLDGRLDNAALIAGALGAGLAAAFVAHAIVEKPLIRTGRSIGDRLFRRPAQTAVAQERAW